MFKIQKINFQNHVLEMLNLIKVEEYTYTLINFNTEKYRFKGV